MTTGNANEISKALAEPFAEEMERTIVKSGVQLIYLPISEVINRLNKVLGVDGWSFEIVSVKRDEIDQDELVAHVILMAEIDGKTVFKHGIGGQSVKRQRKDNKPVDLGNDFKGAVSDALKKAAQQLGVGLYLARSADALDAEDASLSAPQQGAADFSVSDAAWNDFVTVTKTLTPEQKESLNDFWSQYSGGKAKPTRQTASTEDIEALTGEAIRLSFSAKTARDSDGE